VPEANPTQVITLNELRTAAEEEAEAAPDWVQEKGPYRPERSRFFDLLNTKLEVAFDWEQQRLMGKAALTMRPYFYPQDTVVLDAKNFDIHQVQLASVSAETPLRYEYDSLQLKVFLDRTYSREETLTLQIDYTAKPNERQTGGSAAITSDKGLYFIDPKDTNPYKPQQIWTQGETEANSFWFPTFDSPNFRTSQEIYITADTTYEVLSNGKLVYKRNNGNGTHTYYWKQEKPHAPYLFMMAVGDFAIVEDEPWQDIPISYYVEPEYAEYADDVFGHTREMIGFFSELLDYPYPWDKYAQVVVRDFVSGAMENTSASVFMEQLQVDDRYLIDSNWDQIIAHELFHQWFGNVVTCESWANLPLNEAFANYSEYLWIEHKYGASEAGLMWQEELDSYLFEAESKRVPLIRYHYTDKEDMFDSHSYAKGCIILHMLRHQIGDEAFFKSLQLYLKRHEYSSVEIHDLRLIFEEVTGQDLNWFFNQWFLSRSHPQLNILHTYDSGKLEMRVRQLQDTRYTKHFRIPTEVAIWVDGVRKEYPILIDDDIQTLTFELPQAPDLVLFDPDHVIVGEVDYLKPTHEFIFQYYNAAHILHRKVSLEELAVDIDDPVIKKVFIDALSDKEWKLREIAVDAFDGYEGPDQGIIIERLKNMALNDPKSQVRASAVAALIGFGPEYLPVVEKALQDSSYYVVATSLYAYANLGGTDPLAKFAEYEDSQDITMIATLADYYSYFGIPNKLDWFVEKLRRKGGQELGFLLNYFGSYLMNRPVEAQQQGVEVLKTFFTEDYSSNIKAAAFRSLSLLSELEGVTALMEEIYQNETDERAKMMYRNMGLE